MAHKLSPHPRKSVDYLEHVQVLNADNSDAQMRLSVWGVRHRTTLRNL